MRKFAKLYETDLGQILVSMEANDQGNPNVNLRFIPGEMFGVCEITATDTQDNSDYAHEVVQTIFDGFTKEKAYDTVKNVVEALK